MSLALPVYLVILTVVYLYPNSRGSLGVLWALGFVLLQALLTWIAPVSFVLLTLSTGGFIIALFLILNRFALDPFADSNAFHFLVGVVERLSKLLALVGITPQSKLRDVHDSAQVRRVYAQLNAQHWSKAEDQICRLSDSERCQLVRGLADTRRRPAILDTWLKTRRHSAIAWVVSGQQRIAAAWAARGTGLAHTVTTRGMAKFSAEMQLARADLRNAASLDNKLVDPYVGLLTITMAEGGERKSLWDLFAKVRVFSAEHYDAHVCMTTALSEKWGGDSEEALQFARTTLEHAPPTSALAGILAVAHIECWLQLDIDELGYESEMYFRTTPVLAELKQAYKSFDDLSLDHQVPLNSDVVQALNAFAFCFFKGGQYQLAREVFARLQGEYVEYPWQYCVDPAMATFNTAFAIDHVKKILDQRSGESIDPLIA